MPAAEPMPAEEISTSAADTANAAPLTAIVVSEVQFDAQPFGSPHWNGWCVCDVQQVCVLNLPN